MEYLYDKLKAYDSSDYYGFHMPGHKRNPGKTTPYYTAALDTRTHNDVFPHCVLCSQSYVKSEISASFFHCAMSYSIRRPFVPHHEVFEAVFLLFRGFERSDT